MSTKIMAPPVLSTPKCDLATRNFSDASSTIDLDLFKETQPFLVQLLLFMQAYPFATQNLRFLVSDQAKHCYSSTPYSIYLAYRKSQYVLAVLDDNSQHVIINGAFMHAAAAVPDSPHARSEPKFPAS